MFTSGFVQVTDKYLRSRLLSDLIRNREDELQRRLIDNYSETLRFEPIDELMISHDAWMHVKTLEVHPKIVFAHPDILSAHPTTALYYRGMALLSRKAAAQVGVSVTDWEKGSRLRPIKSEIALKAACLFNAAISSIIEGSTNWTLDNGYRNILATMGITFDGMFRNTIGDIAETLVKNRIVEWLTSKGIVSKDAPDYGKYSLPKATIMRYGSEPDIEFIRNERLIATIEIKGGKDPAGALERLGAMAKSFAETPPGCVNFLIAGVITPEMQTRLDIIGNVKVYRLDDIAQDGEIWNDFTNEVFHHAIRVI